MKHSETLNDIARRLRHLVPRHVDPERFHFERDQLEHDVRRVAIALRREGAGEPGKISQG